MVSSDFRKEAREKLSGKWGKAACITLAYVFIFAVLGFIEGLFSDTIEALISIFATIIEVPLALGLIISLVKLFNNEDVKAFDFLSSGFNNFGKSWGITWNIALKMIFPILLTIVAYIVLVYGIFSYSSSILSLENSSSGGIWVLVGFILLIVSLIWNITKSYYYQLSYIVSAEKPELSSKEAVEESEKLMAGKRGKLFCLQLSFIGWAILVIFTLGIGYLWLAPYIQFANIAFYKFVCGNYENDISNSSIIVENKNEE